MLHLLRELAFCFWCAVLLHHQAVADEEAPWGPTPRREASSWRPKLDGPFRIPFYESSDNDPDAAALRTTTKGLPNISINAYLFVTPQPSSNHSGSSKERLLDPSGSGDGSSFEASEASDSSPQPTNVSNTGSEPLPTGTSDFPHGNNDSLVPDTPTSASVRNTLFTNIPTSTSSPEQHATHTHPLWGTTQTAGRSMGAAPRHLPEDITQRIYSMVAPETTVPTALMWAEAHTTTIPGLVESLPTALPFPGPVTPPKSPQTTFVSTPRYSIITDAVVTEIRTPWGVSDLSVTETTSGQKQEQTGVITTSVGIDHKPALESLTSATPSQGVNVPIAGEPPKDKEAKEGEEDGVPLTPTAELVTVSQPPSTGVPQDGLDSDDLTSSLTASPNASLPDCNKERSGLCNRSDTWESSTTQDLKPPQNTSTTTTTTTNQSNNPFLIPAPLMLVPLYTDWNEAMAAWGLAWEAHVYGTGCAFVMLTLASALNLLCLPLRCPSGCGYFALVSLFLVAASATRSFSLLYDAYGHQDRLASTEASLMLYEAPFPCMTAGFGLVFLLLSMRSRMQLSYSAFQRPCFLACLVFLHFAAAFGPLTLQKFYQQKPPLCLFFSLISRGTFVALATFLSVAYFVFYIYVRADSKHIYHLNNTSPTPAERYNRCPFAESREWDRAAITVCLSALLSLACAGLQLYAILNAVGVAGGEEVFHPWPWWGFQFSCRLCELGVCLTLALVVSQPVYCSDHLPAAGSCWTELLASKSPILPGSYQWTLSQQEKLAIVDTVGLGETESLPLYTLMDERLGSSLNGLDLLYHSNRALAYRDLEFNLDLRGSEIPSGGAEEPSGGSSYTSDSTTDLRPPSPINLRRSIDEALFSESLFPMSLFGSTGPFRSSNLSMNKHCALPGNGLCDPLSTDPGLYRTSSCTDVASNAHHKTHGDTVVGAPPSPSLSSSSSGSSPEHWRGSSSSCSLYRASIGGSSLVLCPSPERQAPLQNGGTGHAPAYQTHTDLQRRYHTLGATSQESLDLDTSEADRSVQEEFITVCRQMDAVSVCSETIDL